MSAIKKTIKSLGKHYKMFGVSGVIKRAAIGLGDRNSEFHAPVPHTFKKVLLRLGTTDVAAYEHVFIDEEYGFPLARTPSVIIDAGANVGMSAAYFSIRYPNATIIAVEPEPSNFEMLRKNARLFPKIVPVNAALWNRDGTLQFQDGGGGHWGIRVVESDGSEGCGISAMTLGSLLERFQIKHVDLLKVDVEGAECEIFENVAEWMPKVGVICAELHDRFRPGCSTAFEAVTATFPIKWRRGELHCVARDDWVSRDRQLLYASAAN